MRGIRYHIGGELTEANDKREDKYLLDKERFFRYLEPKLYTYFWNVSSKYAHSKKNETLFHWNFWVKFYSMYIPEKIYRLFCDLFKLNY